MRRLITSIVLVIFVIVWSVTFGGIGASLVASPRWLQLAFYIVAGVGWVVPLKPLMAWMNRAERPPGS